MKISEFLSENFQFLVVKSLIYLNRRVFVMSVRRSFFSCYHKDIVLAAPTKTAKSQKCGQRSPRAACTPSHSDQGLHRPLTVSLDTAGCKNGEQRPG